MAEVNGPTKSLKSANFVWLIALVVFDIVVLAFAVFPHDEAAPSLDRMLVFRVASTTLLPVFTLVLTALISTQNKARLVFFRWNNPLPGAKAFSKHVHEDDRINVEKLRKNVGAFPVHPKEQNSFWYALYQKIKNDSRVVDSHKAFLLYRDMASLSIVLLVVSVCTMLFWSFDWHVIRNVTALFGVQYVATLVGARHTGVRLVTTVLAIHAASRITAASKAK